MSAFGGLILTNRGRALQAKAQAGVQLKFTSIRVGDGQVGGQAISELTDLIHTVKTLDITKLKTLSGGKAVVGGTLSNSGLTTGFYWREIGVFAEDPDLGEILYCYGNAGDQAEYIPADGGADLIEKSIDVVILVGNASNISAVIDQSLIFVSMGDFLEHTGNTIAHVTQEERETWNAKETPAGAQAKAEAAAAAAANAVQAKLDAHAGKNASTSQAGHVKLSSSTSSTSETEAATPKAIKSAMDTANSALNTANILQNNLSNHENKVASASVLGHVYHTVYNVTLDTSWSGSSAPFSKTVTVNGIQSSDTPIIDVVMSGTYATDTHRIENWAKIYRAVTGNNQITFYATEKPEVSLPIQVKVVR